MSRNMATYSATISIHALREEGDVVSLKGYLSHSDFYPRPPRGGRLLAYARNGSELTYFYPRPPRGGRRRSSSAQTSATRISIHALREEGDVWVMWSSQQQSDFYPRPPRGGRPATFSLTTIRLPFLSTPSARRATAKTETKSLFSNKLYNILHEFRRALIYNGSKNYPNHAK